MKMEKTRLTYDRNQRAVPEGLDSDPKTKWKHSFLKLKTSLTKKFFTPLSANWPTDYYFKIYLTACLFLDRDGSRDPLLRDMDGSRDLQLGWFRDPLLDQEESRDFLLDWDGSLGLLSSLQSGTISSSDLWN